MGDFAPFTNPLMKALQIKAMTEEIAYKREARERERQAFQYHVEDRQRQHTQQDFQTAMLLNQGGAMPVQPGTPGQFQAGLAGKGTVNAPSGQQYSLPNEQQRNQRMIQQAQQKGVAEGIEARTKEDIVNPYVEVDVPTGLPGAFGQAKKTVREKDRMKVIQDAHERARPDEQTWSETNKEGDVTFFHKPKSGGEVRQGKTFKGAGKPQVSSSKVQARSVTNEDINRALNQPDPNGKGDKRSWREAYFESRVGKDVQEAARGNFDKKGMTPGEIIETRQKAQAEIEKHERYLEEQARKHLEGIYENEAMSKGSGQSSAAVSAQPYIGKVIRKANLNAAAAAAKMSVLEYQKKFVELGGQILP